jgi:hypothetical protein
MQEFADRAKQLFWSEEAEKFAKKPLNDHQEN